MTSAPSRLTAAPRDAQDCVAISREVRTRLAAMSADIDRAGVYPTAAMELVDDSGLRDLALPRSAGGIAADVPLDDTEAMMQIITNIAAGESSVAQMWLFHQSTARSMLHPAGPLGAEARTVLLDRFRHDGVRFCAPNNEHSATFGRYEMEIRRATGGVVVTGRKYFATGSGGARYAVSFGVTKDFPDIPDGTLHRVVIDLDDPGVTRYDDWDNMGQRSTTSGSLGYDGVFVPDGFHYSVPDFRWDANATGSLGITAIVLGIGLGAFDAVVDFVKHRAAYRDAPQDKVIRHHLGRFAASLAAAEALFRAATAEAVAADRSGDRDRIAAAAAETEKAKVTIVEAALLVTGEMHRLCGGQSTANEHNLDRFWRNARTLSVQNVLDVAIDKIAGYELR
ncbi:acyl-CoA dehydrogenase family protein [Nocardia aurantia]|uniref:Dibenzothiophene desulfurization enzyme C n=1 Tax=Nocardia aurantia TaxID=2585199 RepID=A0A7K0DK14_9NOCA|nr:acyl-CoA dehydrogenase family protein [Nocardia aurantia]MQY26143.1 Dibenzothiophene desulfurization enzyme C [Nocardia aurantia]